MPAGRRDHRSVPGGPVLPGRWRTTTAGRRQAMGKETAQCGGRRRRAGYFERVFVGAGIDVCCGDAPVTADCFWWDNSQGGRAGASRRAS
jgi:hypothetical protein